MDEPGSVVKDWLHRARWEAPGVPTPVDYAGRPVPLSRSAPQRGTSVFKPKVNWPTLSCAPAAQAWPSRLRQVWLCRFLAHCGQVSTRWRTLTWP
jgi:hypothetical protein